MARRCILRRSSPFHSSSRPSIRATTIAVHFAQLAERFPRHLHEIALLDVEEELLTGSGAARVEQVLDHRVHAIDALDDPLGDLGGLGIVAEVATQDLRVGPGGRERVAEIVRKRRHEALAEVTLGFQLADGVAELAGNRVPEGAEPIALAYAGHQFGNFVPQLGDGRAILLGEVVGRDGRRYDIQLKGSGETPFSRSGDGRAALGPVLREYIVSEAMAALGREHLAIFGRDAQSLPASLRPAFLPLALSEAYLSGMAKSPEALAGKGVRISAVRKHWLLFRRAWRGWA